jgi:hypothetical protein
VLPDDEAAPLEEPLLEEAPLDDDVPLEEPPLDDDVPLEGGAVTVPDAPLSVFPLVSLPVSSPELSGIAGAWVHAAASEKTEMPSVK